MRATTATFATTIVLALAAASLTGCTPHERKTPSRLPQTLSAHTHVTHALNTHKTLQLEVAGRDYSASHSETVNVMTRTNTAGVVVAYDSQGRQRGLAVTVNIDDLNSAPVDVDFTSTALAELALTPSFLTDNPLGVLAVRHAAASSPHLATLANLLRNHAAKDPGYLQHPSPAELAELESMASDAENTLETESASLSTMADTDVNPAAYRLEAPSCGGAPYRYAVANTGICYTEKGKQTASGDIELTGTNTSPNWGMLFSTRQTIAPLGFLPPHKITIPTLDSLLGAVGSSLVAAGKKAACRIWHGFKHIIGRGNNDKCTAGLMATLKQFFDGIDADGTARITVPDAMTTHDSFGVEGGKPIGDVTMVPQTGRGARDVELWHDMGFVLTVWTQFASPFISLATDSPDETKGPPETPTQKERIRKAADVAANKLTGQFNQLTNDMVSASAGALIKDFLTIGLKIITDDSVLKAIVGIWGLDVDKRLKHALEHLTVKYGTDLIPGIGWAKVAWQAGNKVAEGTTVHLGLYALAMKVPRYDSYISYRPLRGADSLPPGPPGPQPTENPWPQPTQSHCLHSKFCAETWQNVPFTLTISSKGGVEIQRRTGPQCKTVITKCDHQTDDVPIPGAVAKGKLDSQLSGATPDTMRASGMITSASKSSGLPTGPLAITPNPRGGIDVTIGSMLLTGQQGATGITTSGPMGPAD